MENGYQVNNTTSVINPATGEKIVQVSLSDKEHVDAAVRAAKEAQKRWAHVPAPQRAEVLYKVGNILKERKEELSQLLTMENGKVLEEARGEVKKQSIWLFTWQVKVVGYLDKRHHLS